MASLLYGSGLRLLECCHLRVKDLDFASNQIIVRAAKGDKDRVTMLPAAIKADLARHLEQVHEQHGRDLQTRRRMGRASDRALPASTRTPAANGCGNGSSRRPGSTVTASPGSCAGTTFTSPCSSAS